jgi:FAD:protein FMN transferase
MLNRVSLLLTGVAAAGLSLVQPAYAGVHRFQADHVLGTSFGLTVNGVDANQAAAMRDAALGEIERLNAVLSGWRPDSELARLNAAQGPVVVSDDLFKVIAACEQWRTLSGGAFSGRMGAAQAAWRTGDRPDPQRLAEACATAEAASIHLDPETRTIDRAGVTFAVDALAKGYIVDAALDAAMAAAPSARGALLDIGGDLACRGAAPGGGWRVGLASGSEADNLRPQAMIRIADRAVATSGPGARDLRVDGCDLNHTLSPASGQPVANRTVTVVAAQAAMADPLATALGVMPVAEGLALASSQGASARIVEANGAAHATPDWSALLLPAVADCASPPTLAAAGFQTIQSRAWPAGFTVEIGYEIPPPPSGRARPPFVAIWITDEAGKMVRTLYHLGNHPPRYLDSNYVWFRAFTAAGHGDDLFSVTRPSRSPGRYTASWDGKTDAGVAVPQGRYTINIEITREHGGHSLQSMPMTLCAAPATATAAAQDEAGPASVRYGRPVTGGAAT